MLNCVIIVHNNYFSHDIYMSIFKKSQNLNYRVLSQILLSSYCKYCTSIEKCTLKIFNFIDCINVKNTFVNYLLKTAFFRN